MTYDPWEARESPTGTLPPRPPEDPPFQNPVQEHRGLLRRAGGGIAAGGLLALKLIGNLAFLFKFKFLLSFVISQRFQPTPVYHALLRQDGVELPISRS